MTFVNDQDVFCPEPHCPVLNGAMGVDKVKVIDGSKVDLLRFISILCLVNDYLDEVSLAAQSLPYL
eukprot:5421004-Amphidinium_carterae.1